MSRMNEPDWICSLLVYGGYLVFQLWSHSYLYSDIHNRQSPVFASRESKSARSSQEESRHRGRDTDDFLPNRSPRDNGRSDNFLIHPLRYPVHSSSSPSPPRLPSLSRFTTSSESLDSSRAALVGPYGETTVRLVPPAGGYSMPRVSSGRSTSSTSTMIYTGSQDGSDKIESPIDIDQGSEGGDRARDMPHEPRIGIFLVVLVLVIVTVAASVTADWLVDSMDGVSSRSGFSAECTTAVNVSVRDELTFSIGVAVGSAIYSEFDARFIVTLAWAMGKPLSLLMDPFQSLTPSTYRVYLTSMYFTVAIAKDSELELVFRGFDAILFPSLIKNNLDNFVTREEIPWAIVVHKSLREIWNDRNSERAN
ncbi:hypothetical protein C0995_000104 [Termitomyces sp. Mi166|nr:hypothetical protein C0995_000104 [Termitomyces sp. Mi166\